ncbi:MAG: PDZ domain-containing protein [Gammaproteobacteria bacterium]|nr:PDZ domain-containing protein [Gammaproteobacteria bacterium]MCW8972052.1 PDZ domain-containing protein [Gammaproteobacteria bacterium]MCW8993828.1 PDZ domain-containing protein [Gammaproteobacteria bacterium]
MSKPLPVHYRVIPSHPEAHLFEVELQIEQPEPGGQLVALPAWIPGSYMIRDFAKNIVTLTASDADGSEIALEKLDKQRWRCAPCAGRLTLRYSVYAWDLSVRSAHLDTTHGYFNGTSLFLRVEGQENNPCSATIERPEGEAYETWRVATTLPTDETEPYSFGRFHAANYDELIDHPVEMGEFTLVEFEARGIPHAMVISGRHYADGERLARDLTRICEYHIDLFGEAPFKRYLFQTMVVGNGYGGLEHRSSTSLMCSRDDLPLPGEEKSSEAYRGFLGLCSHEYFHSWNVKRIKPDVFLPYDLSQESYTPLLWAFEGFTAYYDDISLVRCGLISAESYLELLGQTITRVIRGSGRTRQSLSDSSFDAWTKFYKQDENAPNAIVSYYTKGSLVALALDLTLRIRSDGKRSLDDLMRALWQRHGKPHVGISPQQMETLINEVAGEDLSELLQPALRGTEDLPLTPLLEQLAVTLKWRQATSNSDKGGDPGKPLTATALALGVRYGNDPLGAKLLNVFDRGAAQTAGLSAGDIIIAVDGLRATQENIEKLLNYHRHRHSVTVHAFRRDELMQLEVPIREAPRDTCYLQLDEEAEETARRLREGWLGLQQ